MKIAKRIELWQRVVMIYALLYVVSLVLLVLMHKTVPLIGIYNIGLTVPWSIVEGIIIDFFGISKVLPFSYYVLSSICYALLNVLILYFLLRTKKSKRGVTY